MKYHQNNNKNLNWKNKTCGVHGAFWRWFSRFLSPPWTLCYNTSSRFPELVRSLFPTSGLLLDHFLLCPRNISMEYFDAQFHSIYNGSDCFPCFLYTLLGRLNLCTIVSFQGGSPPSHLKIALSCVFSNQKSQKSYLFSHSRKKHNERQIIWNTKNEYFT